MGPTVPSYILFCSVDCAKDMAISIKCRNHYMRLVLGRERSGGFAPMCGQVQDLTNSVKESKMIHFDLSGKLALVTGSSRGIGKAVTVAMAEHDAHV